MMKANAVKRFKLWTDNPFCYVCGKKIEEYSKSTLEHIIPLSKGGSNSISNLAVSHRMCNLIKGNHLDPEMWGANYQEKTSDEKILRTFLDDSLLKFIIRENFADLLFVKNSLAAFASYGDRVYPRVILNMSSFQAFIYKRRKLNVDSLISTSLELHRFGTKNYWKVIYAILFMAKYFETNDPLPLLHAIWRLDSLKGNQPSLISHLYSEHLLDLCKKVEPVAFERFCSLKESFK